MNTHTQETQMGTTRAERAQRNAEIREGLRKRHMRLGAERRMVRDFFVKHAVTVLGWMVDTGLLPRAKGR